MKNFSSGKGKMNFAIILYLTGFVLMTANEMSEARPFVTYDGNDKILRVNSTRLLKSLRVFRRAIDEQDDQNSLAVFNSIDDNSDGEITLEEWQKSSGTFEDFVDLLLDADANHDDKISKSEFLITDVEQLDNDYFDAFSELWFN